MIKLLLLLTSIALCGTNLDISMFGSGASFYSDLGVKASYVEGATTYTVNGNRYQNPLGVTNRALLSADTDITESLSWFIFAQDDNDIWREGIGIGYEPVSNIFRFPYKHKFSVAECWDNRYGWILSWRYKFQGYWNGVGLTAVFFALGYTHTIDYRLSYAIRPNLDVLYKSYYNDLTRESQYSVGMETKI